MTRKKLLSKLSIGNRSKLKNRKTIRKDLEELSYTITRSIDDQKRYILLFSTKTTPVNIANLNP